MLQVRYLNCDARRGCNRHEAGEGWASPDLIVMPPCRPSLNTTRQQVLMTHFKLTTAARLRTQSYTRNAGMLHLHILVSGESWPSTLGIMSRRACEACAWEVWLPYIACHRFYFWFSLTPYSLALPYIACYCMVSRHIQAVHSSACRANLHKAEQHV